MRQLRFLPIIVMLLVSVGLTPVRGFEGAASDRVEHASWGTIKALYRGGMLSDSDRESNEAPRGPADVRYPLRDTPEHVLAKLVEAYETMDVAAYTDCLSNSFVFWLNWNDVAGDPSLPLFWGFGTESGIHANMFDASSDVESIALTLTQWGDAYQVSGAGPGDPYSWEYKENYELSVHLPMGLWLYAAEGALIRISVDPDEVGPAGQDLWEITQWWDVDEYTDTLVDESSWGRVKALYR